MVGERGTQALGGKHGRLQVGVGADDEEFLASDPADAVAPPCRFAQHVGDFAQHMITGGVAVGVVDVLEMVDVDHHHGERLVGAQRATPGLVELVHGRAAVGQAGEQVGEGGVGQPAVGHGQLGGNLAQLGTVALPGVLQLDEALCCTEPGAQARAADAAGCIAVGPHLVGAGELLLAVFIRHQQDVHAPAFFGFAQGMAQLGPVQAGQVEVRNDDVRQHFHGQRQGRVAVVGGVDDVGAVFHQQRHDLAAAERVAVGHHDAQRGFVVVRLAVSLFDFGKRGQGGDGNLQQVAPFLPADDDLVDKAGSLFSLEIQLCGGFNPGMGEFGTTGFFGQAQVRQHVRQAQHANEALAAGVVGIGQ